MKKYDIDKLMYADKTAASALLNPQFGTFSRILSHIMLVPLRIPHLRVSANNSTGMLYVYTYSMPVELLRDTFVQKKVPALCYIIFMNAIFSL